MWRQRVAECGGVRRSDEVTFASTTPLSFASPGGKGQLGTLAAGVREQALAFSQVTGVCDGEVGAGFDPKRAGATFGCAGVTAGVTFASTAHGGGVPLDQC